MKLGFPLTLKKRKSIQPIPKSIKPVTAIHTLILIQELFFLEPETPTTTSTLPILNKIRLLRLEMLLYSQEVRYSKKSINILMNISILTDANSYFLHLLFQVCLFWAIYRQELWAWEEVMRNKILSIVQGPLVDLHTMCSFLLLDYLLQPIQFPMESTDSKRASSGSSEG